MKIQNTRTSIITFCIIGLLSSCVSISKIRYLEPVGDNKNDWALKGSLICITGVFMIYP